MRNDRDPTRLAGRHGTDQGTSTATRANRITGTFKAVTAKLTRRSTNLITSAESCAFRGAQGLMGGMGKMAPQQRILLQLISAHQNAGRRVAVVRPGTRAPPSAANQDWGRRCGGA